MMSSLPGRWTAGTGSERPVARLLLAGVAAFVLGCAALAGQTAANTGLAPDVLLLARIKVRMQENLRSQPNCTCVQTIQRSRRRAPARRFRALDTLRLEVALVDGKEMFSWPGAREFQVTDPREMAPTGAIGTGVFGLHARAVFLSNSPTYTYRGQEDLDGRRCERFDYDVPLNLSAYQLRRGSIAATVAHHGSFWVDAASLDLVRLVVIAGVIPPAIQLTAAETVMDYERLMVGGRDFLLPARAVTVLTHIDGDESRNETTFTGCRQYAGESFLSFGPPPEETAVAETPREVRIAPGLELRLDLATPIVSGETAAGDPIRAILRREVRDLAGNVVPKGAVVAGRVIHLELYPGRFPHWEVALRLESIEFGGMRGDLRANLVRWVGYLGPGRKVMLAEELREKAAGRPAVHLADVLESPGVGVFYVNGETLRIPRGSRMVWRTLGVAQPSEE